jgi:hypothetical protein
MDSGEEETTSDHGHGSDSDDGEELIEDSAASMARGNWEPIDVTPADFEVLRVWDNGVAATCRFPDRKWACVIDRPSFRKLDSSPVLGMAPVDFRELFVKGDWFRVGEAYWVSDFMMFATKVEYITHGPVIVRTGHVELQGHRRRIHCPEAEERCFLAPTSSHLHLAERQHTVAFRHHRGEERAISGCELGLYGDNVSVTIPDGALGALIPVLLGRQGLWGVVPKWLLTSTLDIPKETPALELFHMVKDKRFRAVVGANIIGRSGNMNKLFRVFKIWEEE